MKYVPGYVALTLEEWDQVLDDRAELARLREEVATHRQAQAEYLTWSLGGGVAKALLTGMALGAGEEPDGSLLT